MSFNYIERGGGTSTATKRGTKRGFTSISQQMIAQRDTYIAAEEDTLDQPSICQQAYALLRCCWQDSVGKTRYRLNTHHYRLWSSMSSRAADCRPRTMYPIIFVTAICRGAALPGTATKEGDNRSQLPTHQHHRCHAQSLSRGLSDGFCRSSACCSPGTECSC